MPQTTAAQRPTIALGPEAPEFGSWNWLGAGLVEPLSAHARVEVFRETPPPADSTLFLKFKPPLADLRRLARETALIYCPVDLYESPAAIDADWESLRLCELLLAPGPSFAHYVSSYAPTVVLEHPLRHIASSPATCPTAGPILWTGVRANLPPLVDSINARPLPEELWVLTNLAPGQSTAPQAWGFQSDRAVRIEAWTPERHLDWISQARGAIEIKGPEFRARHKSSAKLADCIASGVPVAANAWTQAASELAALGLSVPEPDDVERWFSRAYWEETQAVGARLRLERTPERIAARLAALVHSAIQRRGERCA